MSRKPGDIARPTVRPGMIGAGEPAPATPKAAPKPTPKPTPSPRRIAAFHTGLSAESRAAAALTARGYRILARRWRSPAGEIDIVALRRQTLVFVEVKARATLDRAAEAVTVTQRRRIAAAADAFLARHDNIVFTDIRFDAVLVAPGHAPQHIPAAFDADA